jgi:hypothetical protein
LAIIDKTDKPLAEAICQSKVTSIETTQTPDFEKTTPENDQLESTEKSKKSPPSPSTLPSTRKTNSDNTQKEKSDYDKSPPPLPTTTTNSESTTKTDTQIQNTKSRSPSIDPVETQKTNDKDMLILVDFELTYSNKKLKKSLIRSQLELELEQLSEILPIIAYKLTNINLSEYMDDFEKRSHLLDYYSAFINKLETQTQSDDDFKRRLFALELNVSEIDNAAKQTSLILDLVQKLNLIQRIQSECMQRLNLQKSYLNELKQLFDKLNTDIGNYALKTKTNIAGILSSMSPTDDKKFYVYIMQKLKKSIFQLQTSLVEYARFNKQNERFNLVNGLPFNCLFEVMDRFMKAYDIK